MGDTESTPWRGRPPARSVAGCVGATEFRVQAGDWADLVPGLAPEQAALLAPPVSVSGSPVGGAPPVDERRRAELARYRLNMASVPPYGRHRRSALVG